VKIDEILMGKHRWDSDSYFMNQLTHFLVLLRITNILDRHTQRIKNTI